MSQQDALKRSQSEIPLCYLVLVTLPSACSSVLSCLGAGRADPVRVSAEQGRSQRGDEEDAVRDGERAAVRDARRGQRQNAADVCLLHPRGIRYAHQKRNSLIINLMRISHRFI